MANCALYSIRFCSKSKEVLERVLRIMRYEDPEYFIYRVGEAELVDGIVQNRDSGVWSMDVEGDVAWSVSSWFANHENAENKDAATGAHYVSLDILAKRLGFWCEAFCEESGNCFQQYFSCDENGNVHEDTAEWTERWTDDEGNDLDEPETSGGLSYYGCWSI